MHFYQHNIADYRKDTTHLSPLEHGIYRQMLDQYYLDESGLCKDDAKLMRSLNVRTADEMQAFRNVLADFFFDAVERYIHKRCDVEIEAYHAKSKATSDSAKVRWERERAKKDAGAMRSHSDGNANHKPITINQEETPIAAEATDDSEKKQRASKKVQAIFDYWKDLMSSPRSALDSKRVALIEKALKSYQPEDICKAISGCTKSPWHMGENPQNTKYNGLKNILESADKIDEFIRKDGGGDSMKDWQ